jgi:hypothetical protein
MCSSVHVVVPDSCRSGPCGPNLVGTSTAVVQSGAFMCWFGCMMHLSRCCVLAMDCLHVLFAL